MRKYKFILKGKDFRFYTKEKGDISLIISSIMQYVCETSIMCDMTKKEFLANCKDTYEKVLKEINECEEE